MSTDHPAPETYLPTIEAALRKGARLHAFRSGGGLRVVRLERKSGTLVGYGEHPNLEPAMAHAAEDYLAGGRPYGEVYGKAHAHYLTGTTQASSDLDRHVLGGNAFDARADGGAFVVELPGHGRVVYPEDKIQRAYEGTGSTWTSPRGVTYAFVPSRFPNGEPGCSIPVLDCPVDKKGREYDWRVVRTGRGSTLADAIAAALVAPEVEVPG